MPVIPPTVLKKLYVKGSLRLEEEGFAFDLKNLIAPATITDVSRLEVDGRALEASAITAVPPSGNSRSAEHISPGTPLHFPVGVVVSLHVAAEPLAPGNHELSLHVKVKEIGTLHIPISDIVR
jgi:hypothetical protein